MSRNHRIHRALSIEELEARIAPVAVLSMTPTPGLTESSSPAAVVVTFDEAIAAESAAFGAIQLLGSGGDGAFTDGNEIVVDLPSAPALTAPNELTLDLSDVTLLDDTYQVTICSTPAPAGAVRNPNNGHWYEAVTSGLNWTAARDDAASRTLAGVAGHLVTITSQEEQDWLMQAMAPISRFHMGLNDIALEGQYVWVTGEPMVYTNWNAGQPDNLGDEDAGEVWPGGTWNDVSTSFVQPYVVEYDTDYGWVRDLDGVPLDGEFSGAFPSGDGTPGGDFVATFEVDGPPIAVLSTPEDGGAGDYDPDAKGVLVKATQPTFIIGLTDGFGVGIDDSTVVSGAVQLKKDSVVLEDGTHYDFSYSPATDEIMLTSIGADFLEGSYEIAVSEPGLSTILDNDGRALTDPVFTVVVDLSPPPTVTSITPALDSIHLSVPSTIVVTFSKEINPATVNEDTFLVTGSGGDGTFTEGNEVQITADSITMTGPQEATFDVGDTLLPYDVYRVTLVGDLPLAVTDTIGNPLDGEFTGAFPSGDGAPCGDFVSTFTYTPAYFEDVTATQFPAVEGSIGATLLDIDNDGDLDLIDTRGGFGGDFVYLNDGNGFFSFAPDNAGVYFSEGHSIIPGDYDNDGWIDFAIGWYWFGGSQVYHNDGDGTFTNVSGSCGVGNPGNIHGGAFADVDGDGDLDLSFAVDGPNKLYINDGTGHFSEQAGGRGVAVGGYGISTLFADIDSDGDVDLLACSHDTNPALFRNDGTGYFTDITAGSGIGASNDAEAACFGDIDNDGDLDLYVRSLGIYLNNGTGVFTDITSTSGITPIDALTCAWVDVDHDGDLDLNEGGKLWLNNGDLTFTDVTAISGISAIGTNPQSASFGDIDGDGDMDIRSSGKLMRNEVDDDNYLIVRPVTSSGSPASNAKVWVYEAGHLGDLGYLLGYREVMGCTQRLTAHPLYAHFGLPDNETVDVRVEFLNGSVEEVLGIARGQTINVVEGGPATVDVRLQALSDTGISDSDNITNDATPTYDVMVNRGGTIRIDWDGNLSWDVVEIVPVSGTYAFAPTSALGDGNYPVDVEFTDILGETVTDSHPTTIDITPPDVPDIPDLNAGSDGGMLDTDDITNDNTPTLNLSGFGDYYRLYRDYEVTWDEMGVSSATGGGISNTGTNSRRPSIALDADGHPVVAWRDYFSGDSEIYVRSWNAVTQEWVEMPAGSATGVGISDNTGLSESPSIAAGPGGTLAVAWEDNSSGDREIYVKWWDGSSWSEKGGSATGGGISDNSGDSRYPSVAIWDGNPIVTWFDYSDPQGDAEIYVRCWNGSSWAEVGAGSASGGGISDNSRASWHPCLSVGSDGRPILAWAEYPATIAEAEIYVRQWDGTSWVELGGSATGGGISNTVTKSRPPSIIVDTDGYPIVAWGEDFDLDSTSDEIYVRRWNGTSWEEMGTGSASGTGISNSPGNSDLPALAVGRDGSIFVSWWDTSDGDTEIYVRRWNPVVQTWDEVPTGSASEGGISNNDGSGEKWGPSIVVDQTGHAIVTWSDNSAGNDEIYVRRLDDNQISDDYATNPTFTETMALSDGDYSYTLVAVDAAGNTSGHSDPLVVTIDTTPPTAVTDPDLNPGSDSGKSDTDNITNVAEGLYTGTYTETDPWKIELREGAAVHGIETTPSGGTDQTYNITSNALAEGEHALVSRVYDVAGNYLDSSVGSLHVWIDTTAPGATVPDLNALSDTGMLDDDNITQGFNPQFDGIADDSLSNGYASGVWKLEVSSDDGKTATDSSSPFYSVTLATLSEGSRTVSATVYDVAGNTFTTENLPVMVDRSGPQVIASSPLGYLNAPQTEFVFDFNEDMDWSTLGFDDILFVNPGGVVPTGWDTPSDTRVEVNFIETHPGLYRMIIGPNVADLAGNAMNQNGLPPNGEEPDDSYTAQFILKPYRIVELADGQVILYDTDAPGADDSDVDESDIVVKQNKDGSINCVTIVGNPTGFGMIVHSSSDLPISIMDKRNPRAVGPLEDISFIAYCSSAKKVGANSGVTGWDIGQLMVDEPTLPVANPDLDGDGATDERTALYCGGPVKLVKALGGVGGDVVVKGADPRKGIAVGKLDIRYGDVLGEIVTLDGGLKCFNLCGGDFKGKAIVNGALDKMKVKAMKDRATGQLVGGAIDGADILVNGHLKVLCADEINKALIAAAEVGKVTVKRNLTQSMIHAGGSVDRDYQWTPGHGNIKGVTVRGDMVGTSVSAGVWLGDNLQWDHDVVGVDADTVCALPGSSVITKVCVKGTVTWTGRCGILATTDILSVQAKGNGWKLKSSDLPWPDSNYAGNTGFLIDYGGRWL